MRKEEFSSRRPYQVILFVEVGKAHYRNYVCLTDNGIYIVNSCPLLTLGGFAGIEVGKMGVI